MSTVKDISPHPLKTLKPSETKYGTLKSKKEVEEEEMDEKEDDSNAFTL